MSRNSPFRRWLLASALPLAGAASTAGAQTVAPGQGVEAEPVAIEAPADDRPVVAMGGNFKRGIIKDQAGNAINPLRGTIRAFAGDLSPFIGTIRGFSGAIDPMRGTIRAFEGDVDPYRGTIRAFWGALTPTAGDLDPMIGTIRGFTDSFVANSSGTLTIWKGLVDVQAPSMAYVPVTDKLQTMIDQGQTHYGEAYRAQTGKTFQAGFVAPFLAKHGVVMSDRSTIAGWDAYKRQAFLMDWYDNVLMYSGKDRVDHWMNAIKWSPRLTQVQGGGTGTIIGLVDFFAANDPDLKSKLIPMERSGYTNTVDAHGAAVLSLIVASHDNKGIMGIAPNAKVAAYNPFDNTLTASWTDVRAGLREVGLKGASVVNLSLGVPGTTLATEWQGIFKDTVSDFKDKTVYVLAAGNDGHVQTRGIAMNGAYDSSTFLVVGSVDPNGIISTFSNQPGTACLTDNGECKSTLVWNGRDKFAKTDYLKESGLLMNRFIVAPGEMILVSDGAGGVTRMSGTSFAAPLVSGAIALLHDRWPWLKKYPLDVAKIILESAQDLGAPGVDSIYGHGLLDIEAAQAALDFDNMKYYQNGGKEVKAVDLLAGGVKASWSTSNAYFTAFEKVDAAERDFLIPLSSRLFNSTRGGEYYQEFVYHRFMAWMNGGSFAPTAGRYGFSDSARTASLNPNGWSMSFRGRQESVAAAQGQYRRKLHSSVEMTAPGGGFGFAFGSGDGAALLAGQEALQMSSDFDPRDGGANPLLGFASGGAHVVTRLTIAKGLNVTVGASHQDRAIEQDLQNVAVSDRVLVQGLDPYQSMAATARLDYAPASWLSVSAALTRLNERRAFMGVRSLDRSDFGGGATSDGVTIAADVKVGGGLSLFGSATAARSHAGSDSAMRVGGVRSTAFQAGVAKAGLLGSSDQLRLTIAQPLTVERGYIDFQQVAVIDRETGEKGLVTDRFQIGAPERRRYVAEALYGAALGDGRTQLNAFARGELRSVDAEQPNLIIGGSMKHSF